MSVWGVRLTYRTLFLPFCYPDLIGKIFCHYFDKAVLNTSQLQILFRINCTSVQAVKEMLR